MSLKELITALHRLKVETGSIACLGCGYEHNCGIHGCAIIREAAEKLGDFNAVFNEDAVVKLAGRCLKVEPGRLRELAEADKDGRLVVLPVLYVSVEQTEEIQGGDRGDGGFGNTGR